MLSVAQQTATCDRIHEFLQSVVIQGVSAQDEVGKPDNLLDTLASMRDDLDRLEKMAAALATDDERLVTW